MQNILENIVNSIVESKGSSKNVSRGRKMLRFSDNWKQNVRKRARQSGKSYTNVRGEKVESKKEHALENVDLNVHKMSQIRREKKFLIIFGDGMISKKRCSILKQSLKERKKEKELGVNFQRKSFQLNTILMFLCRTSGYGKSFT